MMPQPSGWHTPRKYPRTVIPALILRQEPFWGRGSEQLPPLHLGGAPAVQAVRRVLFRFL